MRTAEIYVDSDGGEIALAGLDAAERRLVARLRRRAQTHPDWTKFENYMMRELITFYDARRLSRKKLAQTVPFRIAQDLSDRLGIASGMVREGDYRDELEDLIREQYATQRAFCEATGLSEDMLSHFLAGRKDLSLKSLTDALERIGYALHIRPTLADERGTTRAGAPAAAKKRTG